jgi:chromosome segregation ATPase
MSDQAEAEEVHNDKKEIENLMEQVKRLENENQQLHDNILKMGNKKQKKSLEYYVRLKKDLLDEEKKLNHQLTELEMHKDLESKEISSQKEFLKKKIDETNKENKSLKEKIDSHNKSLEKKSNSLSKRRVELKNELDEKKIDELESKVISLTNDLNSKEAIVQEQKDKIDELQMKIDSISQNMTEQINDIRSQYENVYSASKQNEENFNKLYEDKTNNMKDNIQSNKYQLEKKLVHTKNCLNNIENENNVLNKVFEYDLQNKENEINNLKENYERINNIYTEFSKLCGGNLDKLKNNLKQMKEIYLERENEMVNMSKLYVQSMNGYGTSLQETKNNKMSIVSDSSENAGLIEKLEQRKKILEDEVNELRNIKEELVGEKISDIKNKISIMNENVNHLNEKQNEFSSKIRKVNEFTNTINRNSSIFNTLQQNIKNYQKKNENLEKKLTKMNIGGEKELNELKEKLQKLEQEKITKEESIAKYDKMFDDVIESINNQDEVRTDVLKRLNDQITSYKSQIDKLLESKDNMQTYYMDEVKRLNEKIAFLTSENTELKTDNENLKKEKKNTKGDSDLCNQEYNQFKDAFYAISDIENMIGEFNKSSEEVKNIRDYLLADELLKTKEDIKLKNKEIKVLKEALNETNLGKSNRSSVKSGVTNNLAKKKNNNSDFAEMSKNIKTKLKIYNVLVDKKAKEVEGLENHIKMLKDYNNFSKKCGENQELLCEENKIMTDELINDFSGLNQFEEELKNEIQFLEQKLKINEESHSNSIQILNNNVNQQLNAIKDRENYIIKQSEQITDGLKKVANQKQNAVDILKVENQQLKDRNYIINTKL